MPTPTAPIFSTGLSPELQALADAAKAEQAAEAAKAVAPTAKVDGAIPAPAVTKPKPVVLNDAKPTAPAPSQAKKIEQHRADTLARTGQAAPQTKKIIAEAKALKNNQSVASVPVAPIATKPTAAVPLVSAQPVLPIAPPSAIKSPELLTPIVGKDIVIPGTDVVAARVEGSADTMEPAQAQKNIDREAESREFYKLLGENQKNLPKLSIPEGKKVEKVDLDTLDIPSLADEYMQLQHNPAAVNDQVNPLPTFGVFAAKKWAEKGVSTEQAATVLTQNKVRWDDVTSRAKTELNGLSAYDPEEDKRRFNTWMKRDEVPLTEEMKATKATNEAARKTRVEDLAAATYQPGVTEQTFGIGPVGVVEGADIGVTTDGYSASTLGTHSAAAQHEADKLFAYLTIRSGGEDPRNELEPYIASGNWQAGVEAVAKKLMSASAREGHAMDAEEALRRGFQLIAAMQTKGMWNHIIAFKDVNDPFLKSLGERIGPNRVIVGISGRPGENGKLVTRQETAAAWLMNSALQVPESIVQGGKKAIAAADIEASKLAGFGIDRSQQEATKLSDNTNLYKDSIVQGETVKGSKLSYLDYETETPEDRDRRLHITNAMSADDVRNDNVIGPSDEVLATADRRYKDKFAEVFMKRIEPEVARAIEERANAVVTNLEIAQQYGVTDPAALGFFGALGFAESIFTPSPVEIASKAKNLTTGYDVIRNGQKIRYNGLVDKLKNTQSYQNTAPYVDHIMEAVNRSAVGRALDADLARGLKNVLHYAPTSVDQNIDGHNARKLRDVALIGDDAQMKAQQAGLNTHTANAQTGSVLTALPTDIDKGMGAFEEAQTAVGNALPEMRTHLNRLHGELEQIVERTRGGSLDPLSRQAADALNDADMGEALRRVAVQAESKVKDGQFVGDIEKANMGASFRRSPRGIEADNFEKIYGSRAQLNKVAELKNTSVNGAPLITPVSRQDAITAVQTIMTRNGAVATDPALLALTNKLAEDILDGKLSYNQAKLRIQAFRNQEIKNIQTALKGNPTQIKLATAQKRLEISDATGKLFKAHKEARVQNYLLKPQELLSITERALWLKHEIRSTAMKVLASHIDNLRIEGGLGDRRSTAALASIQQAAEKGITTGHATEGTPGVWGAMKEAVAARRMKAPPLSPQGLQFRNAIVKAFEGTTHPMSPLQARWIASVTEARARAWATTNGRPMTAYYAEHFGEELNSANMGVSRGTDIAGAKGSTTQLMEAAGQNRRIIEFFKNADFATAMHELAHVFRNDLGSTEMELFALEQRSRGIPVQLDESGREFVSMDAEVFAQMQAIQAKLDDATAAEWNIWVHDIEAVEEDIKAFQRTMRDLRADIKQTKAAEGGADVDLLETQTAKAQTIRSALKTKREEYKALKAQEYSPELVASRVIDLRERMAAEEGMALDLRIQYRLEEDRLIREAAEQVKNDVAEMNSLTDANKGVELVVVGGKVEEATPVVVEADDATDLATDSRIAFDLDDPAEIEKDIAAAKARRAKFVPGEKTPEVIAPTPAATGTPAISPAIAPKVKRAPRGSKQTTLDHEAIYRIIFKPGNEVDSYGGGKDIVQSFDYKPDGTWSVTVKGEDGRLRTHNTEPSKATIARYKPEIDAAKEALTGNKAKAVAPKDYVPPTDKQVTTAVNATLKQLDGYKDLAENGSKEDIADIKALLNAYIRAKLGQEPGDAMEAAQDFFNKYPTDFAGMNREQFIRALETDLKSAYGLEAPANVLSSAVAKNGSRKVLFQTDDRSAEDIQRIIMRKFAPEERSRQQVVTRFRVLVDQYLSTVGTKEVGNQHVVYQDDLLEYLAENGVTKEEEEAFGIIAGVPTHIDPDTHQAYYMYRDVLNMMDRRLGRSSSVYDTTHPDKTRVVGTSGRTTDMVYRGSVFTAMHHSTNPKWTNPAVEAAAPIWYEYSPVGDGAKRVIANSTDSRRARIANFPKSRQLGLDSALPKTGIVSAQSFRKTEEELDEARKAYEEYRARYGSEQNTSAHHRDQLEFLLAKAEEQNKHPELPLNTKFIAEPDSNNFSGEISQIGSPDELIWRVEVQHTPTGTKLPPVDIAGEKPTVDSVVSRFYETDADASGSLVLYRIPGLTANQQVRLAAIDSLVQAATDTGTRSGTYGVHFPDENYADIFKKTLEEFGAKVEEVNIPDIQVDEPMAEGSKIMSRHHKFGARGVVVQVPNDILEVARKRDPYLFQTDDRNAPYFYSGLERLVEDHLPDSFTSKKGGKSAAAQATDAIKKSPLWTKHLAEEDKWIGLTEWLKTKEGQEKIDASEILGYVMEQTPKVEIKRFEGSSNATATFAHTLNSVGTHKDAEQVKRALPAGLSAEDRKKAVELIDAYNYLNTHPDAKSKDMAKFVALRNDTTAKYPVFDDAQQHQLIRRIASFDTTFGATNYPTHHLPDGTEPFEILISPHQSNTFENPHFDTTGTVHIRGQKRVVGGKTILELTEIQNDWAQSKKAQEEYNQLVNIDMPRIEAVIKEARGAARRVEGKLLPDRSMPAAQREALEQEYAPLKARMTELNNEKYAISKKIAKAQQRFTGQSNLKDITDPLPEYPHKDTSSWVRLGLKTAIRKAAEDGIDEIRLISGEDVKKIVGGEEGGQSQFYNEIIPNVMDSLSREPLLTGSKVESAPSLEYINSLKKELADLPASDATEAEKAKKATNIEGRIKKLEERRAALGESQTTQTRRLDKEAPPLGAHSITDGLLQSRSEETRAIESGHMKATLVEHDLFSPEIEAAFDALVVAAKDHPYVPAYRQLDSLNTLIDARIKAIKNGQVTRVNPLVIKLSPELMESVKKEGLPLFQDTVNQDTINPSNFTPAVKAEEAFAQQFEQHLLNPDQTASNPVLQGADTWMREVYPTAAVTKPASKEMQEVMDGLFEAKRGFNKPIGKDIATEAKPTKSVALTSTELGLRLPRTSNDQSPVETVPAQRIYQKMQEENGDGGKLTVEFITKIGDDENASWRSLPPASRKNALAGVRVVQEVTGNASRLVVEAVERRGVGFAHEDEALLAYLDGTSVVKMDNAGNVVSTSLVRYANGSVVPTAGYAPAAEIKAQIAMVWDELPLEDQEFILRIAKQTVLSDADQKGMRALYNRGNTAKGKVRKYGLLKPPIMQSAMKGIHDKDFKEVSELTPDALIWLARIYAHQVNPPANSISATSTLLMDLGAPIGNPKNKKTNPGEAKGRAAVLIAAHGGAKFAAKTWTERKLGLARNEVEALQDWLHGRDITLTRDEIKAARVQAKLNNLPKDSLLPQALLDKQKRIPLLAQTFGLDTTNMAKMDELGLTSFGTTYWPAMARKKLGDVITQAESPLTPAMQAALAAGKTMDEARNEKGPMTALRFMVSRLQAVRTSGLFANRPQYFAANLWGDTSQGFVAATNTFRISAANFIRTLPQLMVTNTPIGSAAGAVIQAGEQAARAGAEAISDVAADMQAGGMRDKAQGIARADAIIPAKYEEFRRVLQNAGDRAATAISGARFDIRVNKILDRSTEMVPGTDFTYAQFADKMIETGVFASFDASEMERALYTIMTEDSRGAGRMGQAFLIADRDMRRVNRDLAENLTLRSRLGTAITLVSKYAEDAAAAGRPPLNLADAGQVGDLTTNVLYDYANTMSGWDKHILTKMFFPYQAWRKNNARFFLENLQDPQMVTRMSRLYKFEQNGGRLLTEAMYYIHADPYGVNTEELNEDQKDLYNQFVYHLEFGRGPVESWNYSQKQDVLYAINKERAPEEKYNNFADAWAGLDEQEKRILVAGYGGPENVPYDVRMGVRQMFGGRGVVTEENSAYQFTPVTDDRGVDILTAAESHEGVGQIDKAVPEKPNRNDLSAYADTRAVVGFTPRQVMVGDVPWIIAPECFVVDPMTNYAAMYEGAHLGMWSVNGFLNDTGTPAKQNWLEVAKHVMEPGRSTGLGPILQYIEDDSQSTEIPVGVGQWMVGNNFAPEWLIKHSPGEVDTNGKVTKAERYYLQPGMSMLFDNVFVTAPVFGLAPEMNRELKRISTRERTPAEFNADKYSMLGIVPEAVRQTGIANITNTSEEKAVRASDLEVETTTNDPAKIRP